VRAAKAAAHVYYQPLRVMRAPRPQDLRAELAVRRLADMAAVVAVVAAVSGLGVTAITAMLTALLPGPIPAVAVAVVKLAVLAGLVK